MVKKIMFGARLDDTDEEDVGELSLEDLVEKEVPIWSPEQFAYFGPESRSIGLIGHVTAQAASAAASQLFALAELSDEPITLYINSPGGDATGGMALGDVIQALPVPVVGFVIGMAGSVALYCLETCDYRIATINSQLYYHQAGIFDVDLVNQTMAADLHSNLKELQFRYDETIRLRAHISKAQWKKMFQSNPSMSIFAEQGKSLGLLDGVVRPAKKDKDFEVEGINVS